MNDSRTLTAALLLLEKAFKQLDKVEKKDFTPKKGVDYFTKKEIKEFLKQATPIKGIDYSDGENGKDGVGKDGKDGKDGNILSPSEILDKLLSLPEKELAKLLKIPKIEDIEGVDRLIHNTKKGIDQRWRGSGDVVHLFDLSSQLDGITKTFTIPSHRKITLVLSSSTPFFFRPTTDYTETPTIITFAAGIDAPSMLAFGQSIGIQYVK